MHFPRPSSTSVPPTAPSQVQTLVPYHQAQASAPPLSQKSSPQVLPSRGSVGQEFAVYESLPFPWNTPPIEGTEDEFRSNHSLPNFLPKLDGDPDHYFEWHSSFLLCVHQMSILIGEKALNLRTSMESGSYPLMAVMKELSKSNRLAGYAGAIRMSEETYSGAKRLHNQIYQGIKHMQPIHDSRSLVNLVGIVRSVQYQAGERGTVHNSATLPELFRLVLQKLPSPVYYQYKKEACAAYGGGNKPLKFLVDFLASQLTNGRR